MYDLLPLLFEVFCSMLVRFVAVSKWWPNSKTHGSSLFSFSKWCSNAKMYDLLTVALVSKWCPQC